MDDVVLLLPGQGAQFAGMGVELYRTEPVFTGVVDRLLPPVLHAAFVEGGPLDEGTLAQPLLLAIAYATGVLLRHRGIEPVAYLGHSVGELAGAALAGVFDPVPVIAARARAMAVLPPGGMLAVAATPEELEPCLHGDVVVAALNAPRQTVVAGPEPQLSETAARLRETGLSWRAVPARQPFHSPAARPAADLFAAELARIPLCSPETPVWSTRTGRPVTGAEARSVEFWAGQVAAPVRFWPALDNLLAHGDHTLVETGPGRGLSMLARRHPAVRAGRSRVAPDLTL